MTTLIDITLAAYFLLLGGIHFAFLVVSGRILDLLKSLRMSEVRWDLLEAESMPAVTIIAPAYNEGATIEASLRSMLQIEYPALRIIVVNDGSKDDTLAVLRAAFDLEPLSVHVPELIPHKKVREVLCSSEDPRLWVVDKDNGGKADALNAGIDLAETPLVCCVDADTIIEREAIMRMVEPFVFSEVPVLAVGGSIRIANGCRFDRGQLVEQSLPRGFLPRMQVLEYLRAFLFFRLGLGRFNGNIIISGALGMFKRSAVLDVGGYDPNTVGEDIEIVTRMHRVYRAAKRSYLIEFRPDACGYTEAPEDWSILGRQRDRWQRGLLETLMRHGGLKDPLGGAVGWFTIPFHWLFEVMSPLAHLFGIVWVAASLVSGRADPGILALVSCLGVLSALTLSLHALILDELDQRAIRGHGSRFRLVLAALAEPIFYQPIISLFRLRGMWKWLRGEGGWGKMTRKGFAGSRS